MKECFDKVLEPLQFTKVKEDLRPKTHPGFYGIILMILWRKKAFTKFCVTLISSHEVMKLQSLKSGVSDVTPAIIETFHHCFFAFSFYYFVEKELFTQFYVFVTISHEFMKLRRFE